MAMKKLKFLVSLVSCENDYQREQAAAAKEAAARLNIEIETLYADSDGVQQSQQLLQRIQSSSTSPLDGIIFQPVGTPLSYVAQAATAAGIGWVILHRHHVDYLSDLRKKYASLPIFSVSSDHEEEGRIQGAQFGVLLPQGGTVLYIQGPTSSSVTEGRLKGMQGAKPANIQLRIVRGMWTEESAYKAVCSWLGLSTSHQVPIGIVGCQNDAMAIGAKKAFTEHTTGAVRDRFLSIPYVGCDGVPSTGQAWVRRGLMNATIIVQPLTGLAVEMLAQAIRTSAQPREYTVVSPKSFPSMKELQTKSSVSNGGNAVAEVSFMQVRRS